VRGKKIYPQLFRERLFGPVKKNEKNREGKKKLNVPRALLREQRPKQQYKVVHGCLVLSVDRPAVYPSIGENVLIA